MKPPIRNTLAVLVFGLASTLSAQTLWQKAEVRMTPAQVKSAFPDASVIDGQLSVPTSVLDQPFLARFRFKDDRLSEVRLVLTKKLQRGAGATFHAKLVTALRA